MKFKLLANLVDVGGANTAIRGSSTTVGWAYAIGGANTVITRAKTVVPLTAPELTLVTGLLVPGHLLVAMLGIVEEVGENPLVILALLLRSQEDAEISKPRRCCTMTIAALAPIMS
jgi:hypothetical protein